MRTERSSSRYLGIAVAVLAMVPVVGMQVGCATRQAMHSGSGVPASQGTVTATKGDNGNTKLTVRVKHLAPPSRVESDAMAYVVWVQPANGASQNVGTLTLDDQLEGKLDTVTPHNRFLVTVTPEPNMLAAEPTNEPVLRFNVESVK